MEKVARYEFIHDREKIIVNESDIALVQLRVTYQGRYILLSNGIYCTRAQFQNQVIVNHEKSKEYNSKLIGLLANCKSYENEKKHTFSLKGLKEFIAGGCKKENFAEWLKRSIESNPKINEQTRDQHMSMLSLVEQFGEFKDFSDFNYYNLKKFDTWLRTQKNQYNRLNEKTTVYGYHKRLKPYIKEAIKEELLNKNPYNELELEPGKHKDRIYLTEFEIAKIEQTPIYDQYLSYIKKLFLFQCYTGINQKSLFEIRFSKNIFQEENSSLWLKYRRTKTKENDCIVYLIDKAIDILTEYWEHDCFPSYVIQSYNRYLKALAVACGINKNLSTHVGRHSFGNTSLNKGVRLETLQKIYGHAKISTTGIYAKINEKTIEEEMKKLN